MNLLDFVSVSLILVFFIAYYDFALYFDKELKILKRYPLETLNINFHKKAIEILYSEKFPIGEIIVFRYHIFVISLILVYWLFLKTNGYYVSHYLKTFFIFSLIVVFLHIVIQYKKTYVDTLKEMLNKGILNFEDWINIEYVKKDGEEFIFENTLNSNEKKLLEILLMDILLEDNTDYEEIFRIIQNKKFLNLIQSKINLLDNQQFLINQKEIEKIKTTDFSMIYYSFISFNLYDSEAFYLIVKQNDLYWLLKIEVKGNKIYFSKVSYSFNKKIFSFYKIENVYLLILSRMFESLVFFTISLILLNFK